MRPTPIAGTLVLGLALLAACADQTSPTAVSDKPLFEGVPADGNGNKIVTPIDFQLPGFTTCAGGATLDLHIVGWIQDRPGGEPPRQPGIVSFYFDFIYSNAAGETYVWHQVATERFYLDGNGNLVVAVTGRLGYDGNVGRLVVNLTTGEVLSVTGREVFAEDLACAALT